MEAKLIPQLLDAADSAAQCLQRLRELVQAGIDSPGVPADQAFARLLATAERLVDQAP